MANNKISDSDRQAICAAVAGLKGAPLRDECNRLSKIHGLHWSTIYNMSNKERETRETRKDKGQAAQQILTDPACNFVAQLIVADNLDPDLAIETAKANGYVFNHSIETMRRWLRSFGLNKSQRSAPAIPYRRWEAKYPGHIYQIDISGVKDRFYDLKTRRLVKVSVLDYSKNHQNFDKNKVGVWKFALVDDFSRMRFVRFFYCERPSQDHVIDFVCEAFREFGVPRILYSDRDGIIHGQRMKRVERILNKAFEDCGGFKLDKHKAGNPQATGKVESTHRVIEKFEKLLGLSIQFPTIEELNVMGERVCKKLNYRVHRTTNERPIIRWQSNIKMVRTMADEALDAAFKSRELTPTLSGNVTIEVDKVHYQLPREEPFISLVGQKIDVLWTTSYFQHFSVTDKDKNVYWIDRVEAQADEAGDYKAVRETTAEKVTKQIKQNAKDRRTELRETGTELIIPYRHTDPTPGDLHAMASLPEKKPLNPELLMEFLPPAELIPASVSEFQQPKAEPEFKGRQIGYYEALDLLKSEGVFETVAERRTLLDTIFPDRDSEIFESELRRSLVNTQERVAQAS